MDYVIVGADSTRILQAKVKDLIKNGYYPQGAPFYSPIPNDFSYNQAMVKDGLK